MQFILVFRLVCFIEKFHARPCLCIFRLRFIKLPFGTDAKQQLYCSRHSGIPFAKLKAYRTSARFYVFGLSSFCPPSERDLLAYNPQDKVRCSSIDIRNRNVSFWLHYLVS
ncbi:hypothetical protein EDD85DRAFT_242414 [Armillaria nabsnona]|nr:hypothetical protein EDD85DRAFT_242414 [Armillaria nabsnona]